MRKTILTLLMAGSAVPVSATVIDIPADYPTIQQGIDASSDGDTVLVQPGTYIENINFNGHNIVLGSLFLTTGDTSYIGQTVMDGGNNGSVVVFSSGEDSTSIICGFSIRQGLAMEGGGIYCSNADPQITNNIIEDNLADTGGGICCRNSDAIIGHNIIRGNNFISPLGNPGGGICCRENSHCIIKYNIIYGNSNQDGGGIAVVESSPLVMNNAIFDNSALDLGGAIRCDFSGPAIINNTMAVNSATTGGGIYLLSSPEAYITGSIFWHDSAGTSDEIYQAGGDATFSYCDIEGGYQGQGNINTDPLFRNPAAGDFHLMAVDCGDSADSPCIDTGNPDYLDKIMDCSWGLASAVSDMGMYGGGDSCTLVINDNYSLVPNFPLLKQNYPNPFNAYTTIEFTLFEEANVDLAIYDLMGREVANIENGLKPAGNYNFRFNAKGLSSGIYFCRLQAENVIETKRMVLLK